MDLNRPETQQGDGSLHSDRSGRVAPADRAQAMRQLRPRDCDIRLTLPARAENVALVRHVVGALGEALAFPPKLVEDMRLAVTEACTNVVRHAYRDHEGPLEIAIEPEAGCLKVVVGDRGRGILPNPSSDGPGLGLPLIAALADALEIEHSPQRGSRLSMQFRATDHDGAMEAA